MLLSGTAIALPYEGYSSWISKTSTSAYCEFAAIISFYGLEEFGLPIGDHRSISASISLIASGRAITSAPVSPQA